MTKPLQPARPPSARCSLGNSCAGGSRGSMAIAAAPCLRSADRRRVLDAALVPEVVEAAGDAELGAGADIAIERLAVVADRLHDPRYPILGQAELFAKIAVGT